MSTSETRMVKYVKRPAKGVRGRQIVILTNAYKVMSFPTKNMTQYDVTIAGGDKTRSFNKKVWNSQALRHHIGPDYPVVLYDGSRLAWNCRPLPFGGELNVEIDLAPEFGRKKPDIIRVVMKKTTAISLAPVEAWINGRYEADESVQEGMTFFSHLISQQLRQDPRNICFKRTFFKAGCETTKIDGGVDVKKGLFLSIRGGLNSLFINVDVATTAFWPEDGLLNVIKDHLGPRYGEGSMESFAANLARQWGSSFIQGKLRNLRGVTFHTRHTRSPGNVGYRKYKLRSFTTTNANDTAFPLRRHNDDGTISETMTTISDYYRDVYNIRLRYPNLRLVKIGQSGQSSGYFPIELCYLEHGNRFDPKLDDRQTTAMIRLTATRPNDRQRAITNLFTESGLNNADSVISRYGLKLSNQMAKVNARILQAPRIEYSGGEKVQNSGGQWDLKGKKFYRTGQMRSFGLLVFEQESFVRRHEVSAFLQGLCNSYVSHGGRVENHSQAPIAYASHGASPRDEVVRFYKTIEKAVGRAPDIIFCVFGQKAAYPYYNDIKLMCDTELGCLSQCLLTKHVKKKDPQYLSNVCMKINAKLGGTSCTLEKSNHPLAEKGATLVIGADVSHPPPNVDKPSFACMVGSLDLQATRFGAISNTNGHRREMISSDNMELFLKTMLRNFRRGTGLIPDRILYFRDGVSDQEYGQVISQEVTELKKVCATMPIPDGKGPYNPKLTVTICSKRHHYRFFPMNNKDGDRNGNVMPGTLVESDICDPSEYDFYLNSHKAIQGTARSTHYYVIYDENRFAVDDFQALCYNMCFTYIRSTTAVSMIPAAYYAHVAAKRGAIHLMEGSSPSPTEGTGGAGRGRGTGAGTETSAQSTRAKKLHHNLIPTMWYI